MTAYEDTGGSAPKGCGVDEPKCARALEKFGMRATQTVMRKGEARRFRRTSIDQINKNVEELDLRIFARVFAASKFDFTLGFTPR